MGLYISSSRKNTQISHGHAALQSPGQGEIALLLVTRGGNLQFHSLLVFTHKFHRQQKQELCPLPPMLCRSVFWAEARRKPLPPDIKPVSPTLTAAFGCSVTEQVSGGSDETFPAGLCCNPSPVPPEALNHGNTVLLLPLQAGASQHRGVGSCLQWRQEQYSFALALSLEWTPFPFPFTSIKPSDWITICYLPSYCFPCSRGLKSSMDNKSVVKGEVFTSPGVQDFSISICSR